MGLVTNFYFHQYLDSINIGDIGRYEQSLLEDIRAKHSDLLDQIRTGGELTEEIEKKLNEIIGNFTKSFK